MAKDFFSAGAAIPEEITELTGITDAMVAGHRINSDAVTSFAIDAVVVIAHNAHFDRKFVERYWPIFEKKGWACSATEIEWGKHGFDGSRLGYSLAGIGRFYQAHRAADDCRALLEILASQLPETNKPALAALLDRAWRKTMRICAEQSPFELKDELKKRGYRWSDGADGRPRSWYTDVDEAEQANEIEFLRKTIHRCPQHKAKLRQGPMTALGFGYVKTRARSITTEQVSR